MPEDQNVKGDKWLSKTVEILTALGWEQHGDIKVDIFSEKTQEYYGIDAYFTYSDPYDSQDIGIFIEAKNRKWRSVNSSFIQETVKRVAEVLQEVPTTKDFNAKLNLTDVSKIDTSFILLWVDDNYDDNKFSEYLIKCHSPRKWQTQRIFIASNEQILRFISIIETSRKLIEISKNSQKEFRYYYPSLTDTRNEPRRLKHLTLDYLYSKYIFGKMISRESNIDHTISKRINVVFYSDQITFPALKLMYNALIRFQLLDDVHEVRIFFYDIMDDHRTHLEEFKRHVSKNTQVKFEYEQMIRIQDVYSWRN
jgi:hypothetical protein